MFINKQMAIAEFLGGFSGVAQFAMVIGTLLVVIGVTVVVTLAASGQFSSSDSGGDVSPSVSPETPTSVTPTAIPPPPPPLPCNILGTPTLIGEITAPLDTKLGAFSLTGPTHGRYVVVSTFTLGETLLLGQDVYTYNSTSNEFAFSQNLPILPGYNGSYVTTVSTEGTHLFMGQKDGDAKKNAVVSYLVDQDAQQYSNDPLFVEIPWPEGSGEEIWKIRTDPNRQEVCYASFQSPDVVGPGPTTLPGKIVTYFRDTKSVAQGVSYTVGGSPSVSKAFGTNFTVGHTTMLVSYATGDTVEGTAPYAVQVWSQVLVGNGFTYTHELPIPTSLPGVENVESNMGFGLALTKDELKAFVSSGATVEGVKLPGLVLVYTRSSIEDKFVFSSHITCPAGNVLDNFFGNNVTVYNDQYLFLSGKNDTKLTMWGYDITQNPPVLKPELQTDVTGYTPEAKATIAQFEAYISQENIVTRNAKMVYCTNPGTQTDPPQFAKLHQWEFPCQDVSS